MMLNCFLVGAGGFLGAVFRYLIGLIPVRNAVGFPIKTFLINLGGAFLIGLLAAAASKGRTADPRMMLFLKVGICGGFTTFSTFALETTELIKGGSLWTAALYVLLSVVLGTAAVFLAELAVR